MKTYAGIDLHSSPNYTAVINEEDQRLFGKRLLNRMDAVVSALEPFKEKGDVKKGDVDSENNLICRFTFGNSSARAMGLRTEMEDWDVHL